MAACRTRLISALLFLLSICSSSISALSSHLALQADGGCVVKSYILRSDVHLRYATTLLQVRMVNPSRRSASPDCELSIVVPEAAFVSSLLVELGDKVLHSVVTTRDGEDEEGVEPEIDESQTNDAFKTPRDSKLVRTRVTLPPRQEVTFYVTYEQLLSRRLGIYELVLNLHPGQVVPEFRVDVYLYEAREFVVLRVPGLRSGHEIDPLELQGEFPLARIRRASRHEAHIMFSPSQEQQQQLANTNSWTRDASSRIYEGVSGQLVIQFELSRPRDGEVTVHEGFFAHHFAPTALSVLPKHVVFVLDLSSSMAGRKIEQLKTAMVAILDELRQGDFFSIIQFNSFKSVWSPYGKDKKRKKGERGAGGGGSRVVPVKPRYIAKAKKYISRLEAMGGTNIQRALVKAGDVAQAATTPLSIVVLLTDGETTVGESEPTRILQAVRAANKHSNASRLIPVYSLAFGEEADFAFLRRLSAENFGTARRIYDAEDAAIQLHEVYAELSSPVLANLAFHYPDTVVESSSLTQHRFAAAYLGSELVVAGKLVSPDEEAEVDEVADMWGEVQGRDENGNVATLHLPNPPSTPVPQRLSPPLSRLWAYLTVQQLLLGGAASPDSREEATQLALEYSFVTATTTLSMVADEDQPPHGLEVNVMLPASQEVGSEGKGGRGGDDACSEGGEGEYWFPLQQAFIPCGERRITSHSVVPSASERTPKPPPSNNIEDEESQGNEDNGSQMVTLEKLTWLRDVRYGLRYLVLPKGRAGADQLFSLGLNETNEAHSPCLSPIGEPSHCRHLHFCPLMEFADNYHYFLNFFCPINHFAGVCCPDSIFANVPPYYYQR